MRSPLVLATTGSGLLALLLCACPDPEPPALALPEGCNPLLAGFDCMLPYPSDTFLVDDPTLPSGRRIQMPRAAALLDNEGYSADVNDWRASDGFSILNPVVAVLGTAITPAGLVGIFDDYADTLTAGSPTQLIEVDSGLRVPHFVDLDARATDPTRQALVIRPMRPLHHESRYVVALQGLKRANGSLAPAPEGFRRLRDAQVGTDPVLEPLLARYEAEVFPVIEQAGLRRSELQLAWDFTTGSELDRVGDMLRARELALAELQLHPPTLESINVAEDVDPWVWRRILGVLRGPMVMERDRPGADLARDSEGRVRLNGTTTIPFTIIVPRSVRDSYAPGITLEFGHGVFGGQDEVDSDKTRRIFDRLGAVSFAIDWAGMSSLDVGVVITAVGDEVWRALSFSDRVVQGMVNWLSMSAAIRGLLASHPLLHRPEQAGVAGVVVDPDDPQHSNAGALVYDPASLKFLGISQGHILGGVYSALNPDLDRSVLNVGGADWTLIMSRAVPFARFLFLMNISVPDPLDQQKLIATLQAQFDRIDPAIYAPFVIDRELPLGPAGNAARRRILLQTAIGDTSVPHFAAYMHARSLGAPLLGPSVDTPHGLEQVEAPHQGSALAIYDLGVDPSFFAVAEPPESENAVHEALRATEEARAQMDAFLRSGTVINPCDGGCVLSIDGGS